jgi:hypothetical protein
MAHFAKISDDNEVLSVVVVDNKDVLNDSNEEEESVGQQYLETHNNWPANKWVQTSYNTFNNTHKLDGTPFRGNFAGVGYLWDSANQIFWYPQPYPSWVKNTTHAVWDAPITAPTETDDGQDPPVWVWDIVWNETVYQSDNSKGWEATKSNDSEKTVHEWNGTAWVVK